VAGFGTFGRLADFHTVIEAESGSRFRITAHGFARRGFDGPDRSGRRPLRYQLNELIGWITTFQMIRSTRLGLAHQNETNSFSVVENWGLVG